MDSEFLTKMNQDARKMAGGDPTPANIGLSSSGSLEGRPLRILLAEDDDISQKIIESRLQRLGNEVKVVEDGRLAVESTRQEAFDIVLMDLQMPNLDGFEAVAAIRRDEQTTGRHLPIIALSAHTADEDRERCLAVGFDAYLAKPLRMESLLAAIREPSAIPSDFALGTLSRVNDAPAFDRESALESFGRDESLFREVLSLFLADTPRLIGEIGEAIDAGSPQVLRYLAHTLRGTAGHFAANDVIASAKRLEELAGSDRCLEARGEYETLTAALERLFRALAEELDRLPSATASATSTDPDPPARSDPRG